ncbi:MAG: hypothetical protein NW703_07025 [Nitrospiraceae bacterium]
MRLVLLDHSRSRILLAATALFCVGILCLGAAAQTLGNPVSYWDIEPDYDSSESLFEDVLNSPRELVFADPKSVLLLADARPTPHVLLDHSLFRPPSLVPLN